MHPVASTQIRVPEQKNGMCPYLAPIPYICECMGMIRLPDLSPDAIPIARCVHRIMAAKGLPHARTCVEAGLSRDYARDLFRGKSKNPKQAELQQLAAAMGVAVSDLTEIRPVPVDQRGYDLPYTSDEMALIDLWRLLSDDGRDMALSAIAKLITTHSRRSQTRDV